MGITKEYGARTVKRKKVSAAFSRPLPFFISFLHPPFYPTPAKIPHIFLACFFLVSSRSPLFSFSSPIVSGSLLSPFLKISESLPSLFRRLSSFLRSLIFFLYFFSFLFFAVFILFGCYRCLTFTFLLLKPSSVLEFVCLLLLNLLHCLLIKSWLWLSDIYIRGVPFLFISIFLEGT